MASEMVPGVAMPDHSTIFRRIQDLSVQSIGNTITVTAKDCTKHTFYAVDSTRIKVNNRGGGEWIRQKWKVRCGFIKMHVLVDTDTGLILALRVTDDSVGDSKEFVPLLNHALETTGSGQKAAVTDVDADAEVADPCHVSVLGDGAYASRKIHKACKDCGVTPLIRLRINSTARGKGTGDAWGLTVCNQLGGSPVNSVGTLTEKHRYENQKQWKKRVKYGRRWIVEIVFSAFKRIFGEYVMASKRENMIHEIMFKVATYNRITSKGGWA